MQMAGDMNREYYEVCDGAIIRHNPENGTIYITKAPKTIDCSDLEMGLDKKVNAMPEEINRKKDIVGMRDDLSDAPLVSIVGSMLDIFNHISPENVISCSLEDIFEGNPSQEKIEKTFPASEIGNSYPTNEQESVSGGYSNVGIFTLRNESVTDGSHAPEIVCSTGFGIIRNDHSQRPAENGDAILAVSECIPPAFSPEIGENNTPMQSNPNECKICFDGAIECVFMPCRHACCCGKCSTDLEKCPVCRGLIDEMIKFFIS